MFVFIEESPACRACGSEDFDDANDCEDCGRPRIQPCLHCASPNIDLDDADRHCLDCNKSQLPCEGCNRMDAEECIECGEDWCRDCWASQAHGEFCEKAPTVKRIWADAQAILNSSRDHDDTVAGALLLASVAVGPNIKRCAKFLGIPRHRVAWMAQNLRDNGVWTKDGYVSANWENEETGGCEFTLDVLVALGLAERC